MPRAGVRSKGFQTPNPEPRTPLALWREAGEWWSGEPYREVCRYIDEKGIPREEERKLPTLGGMIDTFAAKVYAEDNTQEHSLRIRKLRDEKIANAVSSFEFGNLCSGAGVQGSKLQTSNSGEDLRLNAYLASDARKDLRDAWGMRTGGLVECGVWNDPTLQTPNSKLSYALLHAFSGYAFGRSTILAEEIPILCAQSGIPIAAIGDPFSLTGCAEFVRMAKKVSVKPLVGASFALEDGGEIFLIARSKTGYVSLSRLITECHLAEPRLFPLCTWNRLEKHSRDVLCLTGGDLGPVNRFLIRRDNEGARNLLDKLIGIYGRSNVFVEIERSYLPWEISVNRALIELADEMQLTPVAGGAVTHARREHFPVQDAIVCADTLCTVDEIIGRKEPHHPNQPQIKRLPERAINGERFLRSSDEMASLFADRPDLLANTFLVAERCDDDVLPARTNLPPIYDDDAHALREIAYLGMHMRHASVPSKLKKRIDKELERIIRLNFARHFLVVADVCDWARGKGILFSGRGSVVDSAIAHCLGLSRIDAFAHNLHFDRFLPEDGSKRPDIDIDFEANHRDDVRQYLTRKYGEDRVATVAAVGAYCTRGIIREVGKALGLSSEAIGFLAKRIHGGVSPDQLEAALEKRPELRNSDVPRERFKWVFAIAERLMDVPRNIRAHSSGVVISSEPLCDTVPVMWSASPENNGGLWDHAVRQLAVDFGTVEVDYKTGANGRTPNLRIIQWDKRSAKHCFDKIDILCLRGQDVLAGTQERLNLECGASAPHSVDQPIERIPVDDSETFRAMRSGELIGIPQSASPAMRQAHIRLRTADLHDASLVQAGIRPGVGGAVKLNELIARRRDDVRYSFSHPDLEKILGLTYGIIVFQEQVDQLLQTFCGYTSGEAEDIREAIHQRRRDGYATSIRQQIIEKIVSRGYTPRLAEEVYEYVAGFQGYGFAQGHALAFAEISIRSIYCQQNFPAEYFAALLSAQPAGYYGPCTLVNEARIRGVTILPPDVNLSAEQFSVEDVQSPHEPKLVVPNGGIRIGLMQIAGVSKETRREILEFGDFPLPSLNTKRSIPGAQRPTPNAWRFASFFDFVAKVQPARDELEILILCGALDSLCPNRRAMLWAIPNAMDYALECGNSKPRPRSRRGDKSREPKAATSSRTLDLPLDHPEPEIDLGIEDFSQTDKAIHERRLLDLDIHRHLMLYERERVAGRGAITGADAKRLPDKQKAIVVGNPIRLRFPPTKSGKRVVFFDLEDETGLLNVTCFDDVYQKDGHSIICSPYVTIIGEAQDRDGHTAFLAHRIFQYRPVLASVPEEMDELPIVTADFLVG